MKGNIKMKDILNITSIIESAAECFKKKNGSYFSNESTWK
jgi:hypothetical protein